MSLKKNVGVFNEDIIKNKSYQYTVESKYSAYVANKRLTDATVKCIRFFGEAIKSVIDVGCGDGTYTNELKSAFPDKDISGYDPAVNAIEICRSKYDNIHFFVFDSQKKNENIKHQDLAVIRGVLHHTLTPDLVIKSISEYADKLCIIEPNGNNFILKMIEKLSSYHKEHEERSFKLKTLKSWCKSAGYRVIKCEYVGFVPFFFPEIPSRIIYFFQPFLEKTPIVKHLFSACYVIYCSKFPNTGLANEDGEQ
ncbi:MAG: class I SAM-dependent methyltransferase [Dissulfurispiraceae bacterium]